jgi:hypothetical protein
MNLIFIPLQICVDECLHQFHALFDGGILRPDGANFTEWYLRLRSTIQQYDTLHMILEPLGPPPGEDADQAEDDAFHDRRDFYIITQTAIITMMDPKMRGF